MTSQGQRKSPKTRSYRFLLSCCHLLVSISRDWRFSVGVNSGIAGVREAVGRDGLQRFMGEKSEAVTSRVGGLICRTFGGLRGFPALRELNRALLLRDDALASACMKASSFPDKPAPLSWEESGARLGAGLIEIRSGRLNVGSAGRMCSNEYTDWGGTECERMSPALGGGGGARMCST
ncbi:hypothetical protein EYF80_061966 [Liparis tanakae]|uniref:Uncharacterized protein n=1 Tax=Liparis tanakae TaxID=230148 RepID=A0A4Z2EG16_9TELE|nr:hypothetical protein EYF80_061966 [Liparis tanakae]